MQIKFSEIYNDALRRVLPVSDKKFIKSTKLSQFMYNLIRKASFEICIFNKINKAKTAILLDNICRIVSPQDTFPQSMKSKHYQDVRGLMSLGVRELVFIDHPRINVGDTSALAVALLLEEIAMIMNVFDTPFYFIRIV